MILTQLTLTNFGIFRGRQSVILAPRPGRPVILIGGHNGAGKSTLLEAIRLCLYGPEILGPRPSREAYLSYLDGKIHTSPSYLIHPTFASVALDFQYADVEALHAYTVTRSWERRNTHTLEEHLDITRDGKALDEITSEHWQAFVHDLIPSGVSQLFFFDGEKIQQLAEETTDQATLAEAINTLLGLDLVEQLQADLKIYLSRLAKAHRDEPSAHTLEALDQEITILRQRLEQLRIQRQQQESQMQDLRAAIGRVDLAKFAAEGGSFARNRERLLQQQAQLQAHIRHQEETVRQLCMGLFPFTLIPILCLDLKAQLLRESEAQHLEAAQALLRVAKTELQQRVAASDLWATCPDFPAELTHQLRDRLLRVIEEPLPIERMAPREIVHCLSPVDQRQVLSWIEQATHEIPQTLWGIAAQLERLSRKLHQVGEC